MDAVLPVAFALGFLAGFKHAFEPDHVLAVSTLLHREPRLSRALRMGSAWGAGHTTTLVAGVVAISALHVEVSEAHLPYFEVPVALMLLGLGGWSLVDTLRRATRLRWSARLEAPAAGHDPAGHDHVRPAFSVRRSGWPGFAVGLVHGLAGSGALLLLVAATLPSLGLGLLYALIYGTGSILGMAAVTTGLSLPLLASRSRPAVYDTLTGVAGALSVVLGASILVAVFR